VGVNLKFCGKEIKNSIYLDLYDKSHIFVKKKNKESMEDNKGLVKVIDIETSSLLEEMLDHSSFPYKLKPEAKLHVIVIRDAYTDELFVAEGDKITKEWMKESLNGCKYLVQHNGVKFDLITLKLFGVLDYSVGYLDEPDTLFGEEVKIIDTLILSRLFNPDRFGGHSLSEWGQRTGCAKMDFRGELIKRGIIPKDSPKGFEFKNYTPLMTEYCILDTEVGKRTFFALMREKSEYNGWDKAIKMEHKLADLAIRRESLGFWFDKDLAIKCVEDLTQKMDELRNKVNPILPPKPMTKTELSNFTPPTTQFLKSGKPSTHIIKFAERIGGKIVENEEEKYFIEFEGNHYELPFNLPLKTHVEADIANLDHVKMTLTDVYGWIPQEWAERDFTKDSKKQSLSYKKRVIAFERWLKETEEGKYKKLRLQIGFENFKVKSVEAFKEKVLKRLHEDFPVRLPTSPKVRVGVEKELCPNLVKLGEQVSFANDFALYLTYKHRKSSIAGGEIEDMDFDEEIPNSGFLSMYREEDGRVPTPAIEIGANTSRYRHIGVCNIARPTSVYGKELRSLFGCGENAVFYGFDYASIEARIMAHYVFNYTDGEELGKTFVAEKPNDLHTKMAEVMGVPRSEAKSINYGIIYGASWKKIQKMTGKSDEESKRIVDGFWNTAVALREFKDKALKYWESTDKKFVPAIDGRKVNVRSPHSILNALFQSAAVIYAKYIAVMLMERLEKEHKLNIDPFIAKPDVCSMIEYHDEEDLYADPKLFKFEVFETKEKAEDFVNNWQGEQLSAIGHSSKGYYICLPNVISKATTESMRLLESNLKINVPMGFEYMLGRTWYDCH